MLRPACLLPAARPSPPHGLSMPRSDAGVSPRHLGPATRRTDAYRAGTFTRWRSAASLQPLGRDTALATGSVTAHHARMLAKICQGRSTAGARPRVAVVLPCCAMRSTRPSIHPVRPGVLLLVGLACSACQSDPAPAPAASPNTGTVTAGASAPRSTATATAAPTAEPTVPSNVPEANDGATSTLDTTTVDGLEMAKVSCKAPGGMLGPLPTLGALAKQRAALAACSKAAETVRIHFAFSAGKTSDVRVAGASSPAVAKCVFDAVSAAAFPDQGSCVVTLKLPSGG